MVAPCCARGAKKVENEVGGINFVRGKYVPSVPSISLG
jgi:hypothetical protein